jgi:hypothetical protein
LITTKTINLFAKKLRIIRDLTNSSILSKILFENNKAQSQIYSSLDYLEDTTLALSKYIKNYHISSAGIETADSDPIVYIIIYGVLQSLAIQQDSTNHILEVLKEDLSNYFSYELNSIKDIRNYSIGHPTKKNLKNKQHSFSYLIRYSASNYAFELYKNIENDNKFTKERIDLLKLVGIQYKELLKTFNKIIMVLKKKERQHKKKFESEKLIEIFGGTTQYEIEKMFEFTYGGFAHIKAVNSDWGVKHLKDRLQSLKESLTRRNVDTTHDMWGHYFDHLDYALTEIHTEIQLFRNNKIGEMKYEKRMHIILAEYISKKIDEIREIAKEIDEDYDLKKSKVKKKKEVFFKVNLSKVE